MLNLKAIAHQTQQAVACGHRVFQIHRFAKTDRDHCLRILHWAEIPDGASVLDIGSGVGAVADYWREVRPDLSISLVNLSHAQLTYSAQPSCCGDMEHLPYQDQSVDMATFCFSLGHADQMRALQEAARVVRPGGAVFIYDMVRLAGDDAAMHEVAYTVHPRGYIDQCMRRAGFTLDWYCEPHDTGAYGRSVLGEAFASVFHGTIPAMWRGVKP